MVQPVPKVEAVPDPTALFRALGVPGATLPVEIYDNGPRHVFVALGSEAEVAALQPDFSALARLYPRVTTNCFAGAGQRWKTRAFAPGGGTQEDPATGSAAGPLACHLARHGRIPFGEEIEIRQGAEIHRPSVLFARVDGDPAAITRVEVGGSAVTVARGEFRLPD
jgi:trans-2,3-dihydro-3-hydroxyanthranilate isomerase